MLRRFGSLVRSTGTMAAACLVMLATGCSGSSSDDESADAVVAAATDPVTLANWSKHPRVVDVRKMVESVESDLAKRVFKLEKRDKLCPGGGETIREKVTDPSGQIRKLGLRSGSDDGAAIDALYYQGGALRFVFREHRAGPVVVREDRIYFDESGKRFYWAVRSTASENPSEPEKAPKIDTQPYRLATADDQEDFAITPDLAHKPQARYDAKPDCY